MILSRTVPTPSLLTQRTTVAACWAAVASATVAQTCVHTGPNPSEPSSPQRRKERASGVHAFSQPALPFFFRQNQGTSPEGFLQWHAARPPAPRCPPRSLIRLPPLFWQQTVTTVSLVYWMKRSWRDLTYFFKKETSLHYPLHCRKSACVRDMHRALLPHHLMHLSAPGPAGWCPAVQGPIARGQLPGAARLAFVRATYLVF